ncbi:PadR family transcriptional regulator [Nocardioides sp. Y6]|uniref:PadR family transcriptional regulator n=1 Tax=Nocardioides malaquae TaxID=2773426 RepID=A0ABR9RSV1_9ACTN|nr:PadR family transcriptional regulator [Nocardioides malaquae]MBE7324616.1 PadR family transcriptional regulator [Nocardioides malaquae]
MALEHALLVALSEKPGSGLELTRRFERSFGYFWHATHQQIYRVLGRLVDAGELDVEVVAQTGRPDKKVYRVNEAGQRALADWLATSTPLEPLRSEVAVKMRGASFGDRAAVLAGLREHLDDHRVRLEHYQRLAAAYGLDPGSDLPGAARHLEGATLDQYLVLRGGIRLEEFWIGWITDYLDAHSTNPEPDPGSTR